MFVQTDIVQSVFVAVDIVQIVTSDQIYISVRTDT